MLSLIISILLLLVVYIFLKDNPLSLDILNVKQENINLLEYGFLIFTTSLVLWFIRILMKITLSNYHLSIDAAERVIMIKTYLSLLKEGTGFDKNDKKVMLDNIFRPTNFGIIKDESSITIADIISSFKK